jgi:glycosyltransferase involved in cell wall biosynthesis
MKVYVKPESIAWGLKYLFGDPTGESIRRMGEEARKEAEKFDWKEIAKQYLSVYERL